MVCGSAGSGRLIHLVPSLIETRAAGDLGSPAFEQLVVAELLADPAGVLADQRRRLRSQRDHLHAAVRRTLPGLGGDDSRRRSEPVGAAPGRAVHPAGRGRATSMAWSSPRAPGSSSAGAANGTSGCPTAPDPSSSARRSSGWLRRGTAVRSGRPAARDYLAGRSHGLAAADFRAALTDFLVSRTFCNESSSTMSATEAKLPWSPNGAGRLSPARRDDAALLAQHGGEDRGLLRLRSRAAT